MSIFDREYYRSDRQPARIFETMFRSALGTLISLSVGIWILEILGGDSVTAFLSAAPRDVLGGKVWKLLFANFAHDPRQIGHILWNMLFLYFFGRELESIYGRRGFFLLYLTAGTLAIAVEVVGLALAGQDFRPVLGASGAVMAVVVAHTLFFPRRQILFLFFIPMPLWGLCIIFVALDLFGAVSGRDQGVANLAHLTGAFVGLVWWAAGSRGLFRRWGTALRRRRKPAQIIPFPEAILRPRPEDDLVSRRIDDLLAKISAEGRQSLSEEEWAFLRENSNKYRS
jgi:membrane associated rhomboid family serine protease